MVKFKPGIPDSFSLDVKPVADLGDYLDEPAPSPVQQKVAAKAPKEPEPERRAATPPAAPRVKVDVPQVVTPARPLIPSPPLTPPVTAVLAPPANTFEPAGREERGGRSKAPRREISMTPETLRMSDELLDLVRGGSGQRDTKANELFHALVLLAYEAKDELDPHTIPKRGRWGTPTAQAYPHELKNAFLQALLKKYAEVTASPTGLQYPVNSVG
ncbi:MAG: hypothetical protein U0804_01570 [Gemmataceae bacterium]